jgi:predicted nucleic acid-binding protein
VKLYVEEAGTPVVEARVEEAEAVLTARIAYAEARAAFARHRREGALAASALRRIVRELDVEWATLTIVDLTEPLVHRAAALAEHHGLRGHDAVHLAAALEVAQEGADLEFSAFALPLNQAARREGLRLTPAPGPGRRR